MDQIGVFAKYWMPGTVKTRLAAGIGDHAASEIYRGFVAALLARLAGLAQRQVLAFTPEASREQFAQIASGWTLKPQAEGDLGVRMQTYFDQAFDDGAARVVLLGTDSPNVPREHVLRALELLASNDVVLGPTTDGGYYLVCCRNYSPTLFENIDWSTASVLAQTVKRILELKTNG